MNWCTKKAKVEKKHESGAAAMEPVHGHEPTRHRGTGQNDSHRGRTNWVFWGFVAVAGFFLFTEHRAHLLGWLPYLLLLACPLMHLFMHGGHGGHGGRRHGQGGSSRRENQGERK